jgi:hypothetical protein
MNTAAAAASRKGFVHIATRKLCKSTFLLVFSIICGVIFLPTSRCFTGHDHVQHSVDLMTSQGKWIVDNSLRMYTGLSRSDSTNDRRNKAYDCPNHNPNSYIWKPDLYNMQRFHPSSLCKEMNGRPLAISGDITSHTFFETIVNAMSYGSDLNNQKRMKRKSPKLEIIMKRSLKKQKIYSVRFQDVCVQEGFKPFEIVMFDSPLLEFDGGMYIYIIHHHIYV